MARDYLKAGLVDRLHVAIAPILLGRESACGTIYGAWRPATRSRRKRQRAAPPPYLPTLAAACDFGDHGLPTLGP